MKWRKILLILLSICVCIPAIFFIPSYLLFSESNTAISPFNLKNLADKSFQNSINDSLAQHIVGKRTLRKTKTQIDIWMGKQESDNIYISNNMLIQKNTLPDPKTTHEILQQINDFSLKITQPVYFMLIPSSIEINRDKLPPYAPDTDEIPWINSCNASLSKRITSLDAVTALSSAKDGQMFYRTDHRLTSLGAYYIYNYAMKNMGFLPATTQNFNVEYATKDFCGSLYQQILPSTIQPDRVDLYHYNDRKIQVSVSKPSGGNDAGKTDANTPHTDLYYRDYLNTENSIYVFLGKPSAITQLQTNSNTGKKLLVFGDENVGTLSQFLILHYDEIDIVDLSQWTETDKNLIDTKNYDIVLFEYAASSFTNPDIFSSLHEMN